MSSKDAHLYGQPRPKKKQLTTSLASSSNLSFSSALTSLLSSKNAAPSNSSTTATTSSGRSRASKPKDDIFKAHRHNPKKRAAPDQPAYATSDFHAQLDADQWQRSKRKMEAKARLYAAMKRGDVEDTDERYAVDFDRKWAESHPEGGDGSGNASEQDSSGDSDTSPQELVEYEDHLGRTRTGTKAQAARAARRQYLEHEAATRGPEGRPAAPSDVIFGDTVQSEAFNPDAAIAAQMEELAAKRDRSLTPPPDTHYDSRAEIRNKGTGFFAFSKDEDERRAQMDGLERERLETERARAEKEKLAQERRDARRQEVEARREMIRKKRGEVKTDRFLEELGNDIFERDAREPKGT